MLYFILGHNLDFELGHSFDIGILNFDIQKTILFRVSNFSCLRDEGFVFDIRISFDIWILAFVVRVPSL